MHTKIEVKKVKTLYSSKICFIFYNIRKDFNKLKFASIHYTDRVSKATAESAQSGNNLPGDTGCK